MNRKMTRAQIEELTNNPNMTYLELGKQVMHWLDQELCEINETGKYSISINLHAQWNPMRKFPKEMELLVIDFDGQRHVAKWCEQGQRFRTSNLTYVNAQKWAYLNEVPKELR